MRGHAWALRKLSRNLLQNALKHRPAGGALTVRVATDGRHAALTVADSGPGIAEALRPRLMPPFATAAEASGDSRSAGVGLGLAWLGLAICLDIVQSLGGRLPLDKRLEQDRITGLEAGARLPLVRQVAVLGAVRATGQRAVVDNPWP